MTDLTTPHCFSTDGQAIEWRIVGGLLGHWAVWTRSAVALLGECHAAVRFGSVPSGLLRTAVELQLAGWSGEQIAGALRRTPAAVYMLRARALARMEQSLRRSGWALEMGD